MKALNGIVLVAVASLSGAASAQSFDFSSPVVTSPTRGPGVWYTDRYAPNGFQTSGGKLIETIAAADQQQPTSPGIGFNNTQGRAYDLNNGTTSLSIDLTVDASWASTSKRWAGLWGVGVAVDGSQNPGDISAYPILEFTTDGGARFRGYDVNTGAWQDLVPTGGVVFGDTYTLNISLANNTYTYTVGGATASVTSLDSNASIGSVILQGYNTGTDYSITWDNLNAVGDVPEPATWGMMLLGFGAVGMASRRRRTVAVVAA